MGDTVQASAPSTPTAFTRPRRLPVQHLRPGDQVATSGGFYGQPIRDPANVSPLATWTTVTRTTASDVDGERMWRIECTTLADLELPHDDLVVVRERTAGEN